MNTKKGLKILLVGIAIMVIAIKGISLLMVFTVDSDSSQEKIGRIELPNSHAFIKIHAENIALNNGTETVIDGKIERVAWNEDYLLFDMLDKESKDLKKMMLYSFKTQKLVIIKDKDKSQLRNTNLTIEELQPIKDYFYETRK